MKHKDFNPIVRYFAKVVRKVEYKDFVFAYDYRLIYAESGSIEVKFRGLSESLSSGDVIIIPPATAYKVESEEAGFSYYIADFDFTAENTVIMPHSPDDAKSFNADEIFSKKSISPFEKVFVLHGATNLLPFLQEMYFAKENSNEDFLMIKSGLLKYILTKIKLLSEKEKVGEEIKKLVKKVKTLVGEEWNKGINNEKAAKALGYHPYYLNSVFLKAEGKTLHKYIEDVKIKRAGEALVMSDKPIRIVAEECGFPDASSFSAFFKKKEGVSPREYRENFYTGCR